MSEKRIVIEIDENGNCSLEGQGFDGPECELFISEIEESLGKVIHTEENDEYYQRTTISNKNRQLEQR